MNQKKETLMRKTRKSSLFLMELIIAILFFSLSAAVCVRLFALSYATSQESTYRDAAMLQAQSMASLFLSAEGEMDDLLAFASASEGESGVYIGSITQNDASYPVTLTVSEAGGLHTLLIEIDAPDATEGEDAIVSLETAVYLPFAVGEGA